ncbi:MAG TPA: hypothetical protein VNL92_06060 [Dehalococcoidia bacterium]|nr:hypothetical protein [Dehalococcoidia bacterium]
MTRATQYRSSSRTSGPTSPALSAMTRDRPYRKGVPADESISELRACAGSQLDPQAVEAFIAAYLRRGLHAA